MSNQITIPGIALFAPFPVQPDDHRAKAAPIEVAEPDAPEQSASEPTLTMTMPEVQALVAAVRADEQALAAKAAQDSRSASPTGSQGQAGTSEWATWEADAAARREAHAAERQAAIAAGTYKNDGLPIRMTAAETRPGFNPYAEQKPDAAASWDAAIKRLGK